MLLSYFYLKKKLPDLNERDYTETDVFRILKNGRVYYRETPLEKDSFGIYLVSEEKQEFIVVNSNLHGAEKLRTQLHETIHHLIDEPIDDEIILMFRSFATLQRRQDITAEALSLILMFSFPTLEKYILTGEIASELLPYLEERLGILNDYGI
jgi:Zn-dependent peptidase ImmA (M78 family)